MLNKKIMLRDYQEHDVQRVRDAMRQHKRILLQEPTGAGKTVIASYMTQAAAAKGKRVYFICHRQELIEQTAKTFGRFGIQTGIVWANAPQLYHLPVQVCSIDTLKNRLDKIIPPDVVIWDECLAGDTEIITDVGKIRIADVEKMSAKKVLSFDGITTTMQQINGFRRTGEKETLIISYGGREITCTESHPFYTPMGWIEAKDLAIGMELLASVDAEERQKKTGRGDEGSSLPVIKSTKKLMKKRCFLGLIEKLKQPISACVGAERSSKHEPLSINSKRNDALDFGNIFLAISAIKKGICSLLAESKDPQFSEQFLETLRFCIQTLDRNILGLCSITAQSRQNGLNIKLNTFRQLMSGLHIKNRVDSATCTHQGDLRALHSWIAFTASHIKMEESRLRKSFLVSLGLSGLHGGIATMDQSRQAGMPLSTLRVFKNRMSIESLASLIADMEEQQSNIQKAILLCGYQHQRLKKCFQKSKDTCRIFSGTKLVKITGIKKGCSESVFDISVPRSQCFFANGVLTHNCHHAAAAGWSRIMGHWQNSWHIGLSATPTRLDGKGLDDHFDILIPGKQTSELILMGNLSRYRFFQPSRIDTSGLHIRMGEYVRQEAADLMDTSKIHGDIVEHYRKQADGKRAIVFAVTVAHSKHIAEAFRSAGIQAIHLDGETPRNERKLAARAFANGDIQVITNVGLFGEGYDLAAQADMDVTVDCVIDAQPTNSLAWCLQKWGRCLRPKADGSKAIILDHAANCLRHGLPDDYREWTLAGIDKKSRKAAEEEVKIKTRQCPKCYAIHRPMPICPECGHAYEINSREIEHVEGELAEIDLDAMRRMQRMQQGQAQDVSGLVAIGKSHGQAAHIIAAREEKERLRRTLMHLVSGAKMTTLDYKFTRDEIYKMKPKELGQWIEKIGADMFLQTEFKQRQTP